MESKKTEGIELNKDQLIRLRQGMYLKEMVQTEGWKIVEEWLEARAHHSWVDPRGMKKKDWEWAELNAFHSHDVANEIMLEVKSTIEEANQLDDLRLGKTLPKTMKI